MSSRRDQFGVCRTFEPSSNSSWDSNNVGRRMLEKMGWESGLGLGKDNQGMTENPLWKSKRHDSDKRGFKSREEMAAKETLAHQSAFEELLSELNAECETKVKCDKSFQCIVGEKMQNPNRKLRYTKMARSKDISNYSIEDFKGIIGKDVTKRHLSSLCADNVNLNKTILCHNLLKVSSSDEFCNGEQSERTMDKLSERTMDKQSKHQLKLLKGNVTTNNKCHLAQEQIVYPSQEGLRKQEYQNVPETNSNSDLEVPVNLNKCIVPQSFLNCGMNYKKSKNEKEKMKMMIKKKKGNSEMPKEVHVNYHSSQSKSKENGKCGLKTYDTSSYLKSKRNVHEQEVQNYGSIGRNSNIYHDTPGTKIEANIMSKKKRKSNNPSSDVRVTVNNDDSEMSGSERILSKQLAEDPEVQDEICSSFVGSNLHSIKGYGNW